MGIYRISFRVIFKDGISTTKQATVEANSYLKATTIASEKIIGCVGPNEIKEMFVLKSEQE